jgi:NAD(P)-dependent dehydrogenase (short-subunit alcohol dehydrogenase family)
MVPVEAELLGLRDKGVLVIGGGRGLGEACALGFAAAGSHVAVLDVEAERAELVAAKVAEMGRNGQAVIGDVTDASLVGGLIGQASEKIGQLHVLVTIVGGNASRKPLLELSSADFDRGISLNLRYAFLAAQAFAASCIQTGTGGGAITMVSSVGSMIAPPGLAPYGVAKAGLNSLVRYMAVEWAEHGIRANAVAPGAILTPRRPDHQAARHLLRDSTVPMRRPGTPEEAAGPVIFLSSGLASYVTGQTLVVDGGALIGPAIPMY